jgi:hypothetical protein
VLAGGQIAAEFVAFRRRSDVERERRGNWPNLDRIQKLCT